MKTVLVPQSDIDNIEKARIDLYNLLESLEEAEKFKSASYLVKCYNSTITGITQPLYYLTHRKYKETFWSKIKNSLQRR